MPGGRIVPHERDELAVLVDRPVEPVGLRGLLDAEFVSAAEVEHLLGPFGDMIDRPAASGENRERKRAAQGNCFHGWNDLGTHKDNNCSDILLIFLAQAGPWGPASLPVAKQAHREPLPALCVEGCGAPGADFRPWRTATPNLARRTGPPVRHFGENPLTAGNRCQSATRNSQSMSMCPSGRCTA